MICVTIASQRHRQVLAEHRFLAEKGIPLVEIRLDHLITRVNLRRLMENRPTPIIATYRRKADGGLFEGSEQNRVTMLRGAIVEGVDYVDLEDGVAADVPRYGSTKRIVSYHNFQETPSDLDAIFERLAAQNADVVKICTMANSQEDNFRILDLIRRKKDTLPIVAFCMGEIGIPSRVLCVGAGSPFTYSCVNAKSPVAPGQVVFSDMQKLYRVDKITPQTEVFGVVADPVGHSLSPLIHNSAFAHLDLDDKVYLPFRVSPEELSSFLEQAPAALNLKGLSVTIPHKEAVLPKLDATDAGVRAVGACNTILWRTNDEGKTTLFGANTDYQAAMDSFAEVCSADIPQHVDWAEPNDTEDGGAKARPLEGRMALIMGAGGVGKAIACGLARRGATLVISDIDLPRAESLAKKLSESGCVAESIPWEKRFYTDAHILVNCTPIGMSPQIAESPFDPSFMRASMIVFDAVYNPEQTRFLKDAASRGCAVVSGLSMFARQAALQFEMFSGHPAPLDLMRAVVKRATAPAEW
ncbi:MAG: type I 3-dehydroquinate dehydratase [Planctomycetia bacterium]|nr:type I 3-dehydroquinate dehydratase [Planctomycetia bacterium]